MNQKNRENILKFVKDRNWSQFHSPSNLAKSVSIEAAELLELFQWEESTDIKKIADEIADIAIYLV